MSELERIEPFRFFCQRVLPAVYSDELSYYEVLCKVRDKLNEVIEADDSNTKAVEELQILVSQLLKDFEKFKESGFLEYYKQQLDDYIKEHGAEIIKQMLLIGVFFGLTSDGYFCAYIPSSWNDINFDTGAQYGTEQYGRLILRYDVVGKGVIDNT